MGFNKETFKRVIGTEISNWTIYKLLEEKLKWERVIYDERGFSHELIKRVEAVLEVIDRLLNIK